MNTINLNNIMEESAMEVLEFNKLTYGHSTTPADGEGLVSLTGGAMLANSKRVITDNELDTFMAQIGNVHSFEELRNNRVLAKIVNKIPKAWQIRLRTAGIKGMLIVFPLEFYSETADKDFVITDGLSKYGHDWAGSELEICNWLKRKSEFVNLNVQFINALTHYSNPAFLLPIVDRWHSFAMETLTNDLSKMKFHNIVSSFGDEPSNNDLRLTALKTCISLKNERYMQKLASDQYTKFYENLKCGRLPVPGCYTYMVTDPMFMLNQLYGMNLPEMKAGEYWCNGKNAVAGLFRSPMIAPFEAQRVNLVSREDYDWFYRDIVIFNGHDGLWELMGGADFDGDTCACIPNDTVEGKIIVDAIANSEYYILHEGKTAQYAKFNTESFWHDLAVYNASVAKADRTGLITNHATKAIEIWHHMNSIMFYAKANNCTGIYFRHPNEMKKDDTGMIINERPHVEIINNERLFVVRGLVYASKDTEFKWVEEYPCGRTSFEQIEKIMHDFMLKVEYLNPVQGDEIDGAKTGFYPELFSSIEIIYQSQQTTDRNETVGKTVGKTAKKNSYWSYSPLAIVHDYAEMKYAEFMSAVDSKVDNKIALVKNLLTVDENKVLNSNVKVGNDIMSFVNYIKGRKVAYGNKIAKLMRDSVLSDEERIRSISAIRDGVDILENGEIVHHKGEKEELLDIARMLNMSDEVLAVACYIATNEKDQNQDKGLSYGWLFFDELLSVFARHNDSVTLYRVPANTETVSIVNGNLFVNDKKFAEVEADDCSYVPVQNINGRLFALVKKNAKTVDIVTVTNNIGVAYNTGMINGFRYNGESLESFKSAMKANGYVFNVDYDEEYNICAFINGKKYARLNSIDEASRNINELIGRTVKGIGSPNYIETTATMKNMIVHVLQ